MVKLNNVPRETSRKKGFYRPHQPFDHPGGGELITRQEFADECDVNNIIAEFKQTNMIRHVNQRAEQGLYLNLPDVHDYQEALIMQQRAELAFAALPSKVRAEWNNDPEMLLRAINDPAQRDKLIEFGILNRPEPQSMEQPPPPVPPVPPPEASKPASQPPGG